MRPKYPPIKNVEAIGFADAWYRLIKTCLNEGAEKRRLYGKPINTLDIISFTEIKYPFAEPMLHPQFPTKGLHLSEYEKQFTREYDWKKQGFTYTYIDRLTKYPGINEHIDQLKVIKERIADRIAKGDECLVSNRDQVITWIPEIDLFMEEDQPCLQRIWFQIYKYPDGGIPGRGDFHVVWRSRDLYAAWNSNLVALTKMIDREVFAPNNIEIIRVVDFCNSLHIYEGDQESAKEVRPIAINPQLMR